MQQIPDNILNEAEKYLNYKLQKKDDLNLIISAYNKNNDVEGFENLCFTGKYLNGLFRVLKSSAELGEIENSDQIRKDLTDNLEKLREQLSKNFLILNGNEKSILEENYLQINQHSLQNLQALIADLDGIKKYLNFLKRKNPN